MTRICHMSSVHRGLDIRIFSKECCSLAEAGYETHLVITASTDEVNRAAEKRVILHPLPASIGRLTRMFRQAWRCYRVARGLNADIYHFHDPELIPYGMLLRLGGKRVLYDVHEDLPRDILDKAWIPLWGRRLISIAAEALERVGARWFFTIVAATPHIAERFRRLRSSSIDINNYPLPEELAPIPGNSIRKRQICYVGGISEVRGIEPLIRALPLVPDVTLVLCGQFSDSDLEEKVRSLSGWDQVCYKGQVGRREVRQVLGESVAGVVTFLGISNHVNAQPNKMFEYMSAGLPVIASDFPLWRKIIDEAEAGVCVNPDSPEAIAAVIRELLDDPRKAECMGKAGRRAVVEKYNWPSEATKLVNLYRELE